MAKSGKHTRRVEPGFGAGDGAGDGISNSG